MSAYDIQIGGSHYKNFKIQPMEFILKNKLDFVQGCIIKRICRYKTKNGIEDLEKIKHEVDFLIEQLKDEEDRAKKNIAFLLEVARVMPDVRSHIKVRPYAPFPWNEDGNPDE